MWRGLLVLVALGACGPDEPCGAGPRPVVIDSCAEATPAPQPLGGLEGYDTCRVVRPSELGFARVRSTSRFASGDHANVLDGLASGTVVWTGDGVKHGTGTYGIGWPVALKDREGRTCRGYVAAALLEPVVKGTAAP